ncbi:MAG: nuclease [Sphingomonas bacterium]|nr:nuclease [Sphingomonas bacterium]
MTDPNPSRTVRAQHPAMRDDIADLVTRRPLPTADLPQVDPFLFLNHHGPQAYPPHNGGLPFGPHPHRGFETVTFILAGSLAHHDSAGHESVIEAGGVQWMTAGSGLVHAELSPDAFKRSGGALEILQLWINLPGRLKMVRPRYIGVQAPAIPAIPLERGGTINLVSGSFGGTNGPIDSLTGIFMATIALPAGCRATLPAPAGRSVFLYVVRGSLRIADTLVDRWQLVTMNADGDTVSVEAMEDSLLLFGHGDAIDEPVVSHGPFVMNTREEITQAIRDYQAGLFDGVAA